MMAEYRRRLNRSVAQAWDAFDRAADLPSRVTPAAPILFFGDLDAFAVSPLRVLTVGLNPSLHEFPAGEPFRRFPNLTGGSSDREPGRYLDAMSAYFHADPYRRWFSALEPLLGGARASYYPGEVSTALHTDICSPVATNPTWSQLGETARGGLKVDGGRLWHMLLVALRPHMVLLSVASDHLNRINFAPITDWEVIHVFSRTGSGASRSSPYRVRARWFAVDDERCLFVFGPAARTPFGSLTARQKRETGTIARHALETCRVSRRGPSIESPKWTPASGRWPDGYGRP